MCCSLADAIAQEGGRMWWSVGLGIGVWTEVWGGCNMGIGGEVEAWIGVSWR